MAKATRGDNARKGTGLDAYISFPGVDTVEGTLVNHDKNGVTFEYNRYGSRFTQYFPAKRIIACLGSVGSNESQLWFRTNQKSLWTTGRRDRPVPIAEPESYGDHLLKSSSPDFGVILLAQEHTSIIGKTVGETGRGRKKKPGKEKSNGSGGAGKKNRREKRKSGKGGKADWD
jgi:hypothetical protein